MRLKNLLCTLAGAILIAAPQTYASEPETTWRQALEMYGNGMYEQARVLFESVGESYSGNGYAALCALKMKTEDSFNVAEAFIRNNPQSTVVPALNYEMALILFDRAEYDAASAMFDRLDIKQVESDKRCEYLYKRGHCDFVKDNYQGAKSFFLRLEKEPESDFHAPGRYAMGYMFYTEKAFAKAESWFKLSVNDPRFKEISEFYIVDCEFMNGNYAFAISEGERIYPLSPQERKPHLARIISESYLVNGNSSKAFEFYGKGAMSAEEASRSDFFYAGTVLYEVEDYEGAIENYLRMTNRSDSLGQIADYHLANSYIKTKNKVAAMEQFRAAAMLPYDKTIAEDSYFNYAKLSFDLNQDPSAFEEYLKKYSTKTRGELIYSYMALSALYRRNYAAAIEAYDKIDELDEDMKGNYAKANYLRAAQLIANGSYSDAIQNLKAASYYLPKTDRLAQLSKYWLAESCYQSEKYADAQVALTELYNAYALDGMKEGSLLAYNLGYAYLRDNNFEQAAKWFDTYLRKGAGANRKDALTRRADCDFAIKDYKAAIASYATVINEYPSKNDLYPYYRQALAYGLSGDRKKEIKTLESVASASASSLMYADAMYELGRAYSDSKDNASAIKTFNLLKGSTTDQTFVAKALVGLGMVYRNSKKYDEAVDSYKEVVSLMPGSSFAQESLQAIESIYQKLHQPEKYLAYVESLGVVSNVSEEEKEEMYYHTAEQMYLNSNWEQAAGMLMQFVASYPESKKSSDAHFYLAECCKSLGRKEKACEEYQASIDAFPAGNYIEQALAAGAELNFGMERYQKAYELYKRLLAESRLDSNKAAAKVGMMRSAFNSKDYASAIRSSALVSLIDGADASLLREAKYIKAKSLLSSSYRNEALEIFAELAANPSDNIGAESRYLEIQDIFDKGKFDEVETKVYDFVARARNQSYWLARAYVVLGDSFIERGNYSQAKATFESLRKGYVASNPDDEVPETVEERLAKIETLISK